MENQSFKKALFGGFDREEVLDYLDKLNSQFKRDTEALETKLRRSEAEKAQMTADLETVKNALEVHKEQIQRLEQTMLKQKSDNDRLQQLNIESDQNLREQYAQNTDLKAELRKTQDELAEKAERLAQIDAVGFQADQLISEANARATATLADANNRSKDLLTDAAKEARETTEKAARKAEELVAKASEESDRMRSTAQEYVQQAKHRLNDREGELTELEKKAGVKASQILRDAEEKAKEILQTAKRRAKTANDQYECFVEEVADVKQTFLELLRELENRVNTLDSGLPDSLVVEPILNGEISDTVSESAEEQPQKPASETEDKTEFFRSAANIR